MRSRRLRGMPQPAVGERDCGTLVPRHFFFQLQGIWSCPAGGLPWRCALAPWQEGASAP